SRPSRHLRLGDADRHFDQHQRADDHDRRKRRRDDPGGGAAETGGLGTGGDRMPKFIIEPHFRLHEWIAEEKGYFTAEGLDYEFLELVQSTDGQHHKTA